MRDFLGLADPTEGQGCARRFASLVRLKPDDVAERVDLAGVRAR